ncbi:MAG: NADH-quinone oxidoreductase subunit I [Thermaerobacter sp.]|nr:NADH-quinone oxidoreductase subunit I [Thermaerobacter sp.]
MAKKASRVVDVRAAVDAASGPLQEAAGTLAGMEVTLRNMVRATVERKHVTIQYPEQRKPYSRRFRGVHVLTLRDDGRLKCTACYLCETVCPAQCITIEAMDVEDPTVEKAPSVYEIDLSRCIFCGFCVEACPEEALIMSREYDLSATSREPERLTYGISALTQRPEIAAYGAGFRPHMDYPLVESYLPSAVPGPDGRAKAKK